jgi:hypothetical protein
MTKSSSGPFADLHTTIEEFAAEDFTRLRAISWLFSAL